METAVGSRKHKRKKEGVRRENGGTEAKVSRGEKGAGAQAEDRKAEGWLCPMIMTVTGVMIIMRVLCRKLLVLSVERAPEE